MVNFPTEDTDSKEKPEKFDSSSLLLKNKIKGLDIGYTLEKCVIHFQRNKYIAVCNCVVHFLNTST